MKADLLHHFEPISAVGSILEQLPGRVDDLLRAVVNSLSQSTKQICSFSIAAIAWVLKRPLVSPLCLPLKFLFSSAFISATSLLSLRH